MKDTIVKLGVLTSVFILGTIVGSKKKEHAINKKINYCGVLQVTDRNELYLALNVEPDVLLDSTTVMFKVNRVKIDQ